MATNSASLLAAVDQAISDLLTSGVAAWQDGGQNLTMNDLAKLQAMRRELLAEVNADAGGNFHLALPLRCQ